MEESGRPTTISQTEFDAIQARKPAAMKLIEGYLKAHFGSVDPTVMTAFEEVPREYYHYMYADHVAAPAEAYETTPKPWAIGYGSALSDYLGQAYMTQFCKPKPGMTTLEVGTGSGFQSFAAVAHRRPCLLDRDHRAARPRGLPHLHAARL